jgi:DMSO/TMAO reductase YedYZ molybdopterin-dependent catalytic subunit
MRARLQVNTGAFPTNEGDGMNSDITYNAQRRRVLTGGVGLFAATSLGTFTHPTWAQRKPLPQYVEWKNADSMIVHSSNTLETKREALGDYLVTPEQNLYIRNNLPPPDASVVADRNAWKVAFEGVKNPRTLTVADLKAMGTTQLTMVLQCSGNGRAFFEHKTSGTQWSVGAAGCVTWGGVPLRKVIAAMGGVNGGMKYLTGTGGETLPAGLDPKSVIVERSVPAEMLDEAILAWEVNGNPISLGHGGPLRLIIPGFAGVNNVKYIKRVAFTPEQTDARIQSGRYRMAPLGQKANPGQQSVWEMSVKSWITTPTVDAAAGTVVIRGVAFGGRVAAKGVEVSIDGGKTWQQASFVGEDLGRYAWRQFAMPVRLAPGTHVLACRATDANGNVQAENRVENASGYNNTSWRDHAVKVTVA